MLHVWTCLLVCSWQQTINTQYKNAVVADLSSVCVFRWWAGWCERKRTKRPGIVNWVERRREQRGGALRLKCDARWRGTLYTARHGDNKDAGGSNPSDSISHIQKPHNYDIVLDIPRYNELLFSSSFCVIWRTFRTLRLVVAPYKILVNASSSGTQLSSLAWNSPGTVIGDGTHHTSVFQHTNDNNLSDGELVQRAHTPRNRKNHKI